MKINIYYGGRGILDDPTLFVLNKIQEVLLELNVKVERFHLFEMKNTITSLPASLNDADAIILATTVEWYGIGGYMSQFLDACWLYGNKEQISKIYMCPVVMSTTSGERDAMAGLQSAWEILGGTSVNGLCGFVDDMTAFEVNADYQAIIEKHTENLYRCITQKTRSLPSSNQATRINGAPKIIPLTPQETEQLSKYASDENYVQQQKEDIMELSNLFKGKLQRQSLDEELMFISDFESHFKPEGSVTAIYRFVIEEKRKPLIVDISDSKLKCYYGVMDNATVSCKLSEETMSHIVAGQMTFQRAFMTGLMQEKGDLNALRMLDHIFNFSGVTE